MNRFIFFCCFIFLAGFAFPQSPAFRHYTPRKDGMPQIQVRNLYFAPDGALWISTYGGIGRFNGKSFTNYTIRQGLCSNITFDVKIYSDTVWVVSRDGLDYIVNDSVFNYRTATPYKFYTGKIYQYKNLFLIHDIPSDRNNNEYSKSYLFDARKNHYVRKIINDEGDSIPFFGFTVPQKDSILLNTQKSVISSSLHTFRSKTRVQIEKGKLQRLIMYNNILNLHIYDESPNRAHNVVEYSQLLKTRNGWQRFSMSEDLISAFGANLYHFSTQDSEFMSVDKNSDIWLIRNNNPKRLGHLGSVPNMILYKPQAYWIAADNGLLKYKISGFEYFRKEDGYPGNVWSVMPDKSGNIWFADFQNGLYHFTNGKLKKHYNGNVNYYNSCLEGFQSDLIFGNGLGATVVNSDKEHFKEIKLPEACLSLALDIKRKTILAGCMNQLIAIDTNYNYKTLFKITELGVNYTILAIVPFENKYLLGLARGIAEFNPETGNGRLIIKKNIRVNDLIIDTKNQIWAATSNGLMKLINDSLEAVFPNIIKEDALTLGISDDNRLFVATTNYLFTIDLHRFHKNLPHCVLNYRESAGYNCGEPGQNSLFKDEKGNFWIPNTDNVVLIDPTNIITPENHPVTKFVKGIATNRAHSDSIILKRQSDFIRLPYSFNNLILQFEAIDLDFPESLRFQYKLGTDDSQWIDLPDESKLELGNLGPGDYYIHVRATRTESFESVPEAVLKVRILTPFWLSIWFIILIVLIAAALIYTIARYFIHKERKQAEIHIEVQRLRALALGIQMEEHFIVNCISKISLLNQLNQTEAASRFSLNFVRFLQGNLHAIRQELISLYDELELINAYLNIEKTSIPELELNIIVSEEINTRSIMIPPFLIQPLVENAIKHGYEQSNNSIFEISINIKYEKLFTIIVVSNERHKNEYDNITGNKLSLKIINERLKLFGNDSRLESYQTENGYVNKIYIHQNI